MDVDVHPMDADLHPIGKASPAASAGESPPKATGAAIHRVKYPLKQ